MTALPPTEPGHRIGPHTADCVIEAWGPDRLSCLAEAMKAVVDVFAELREECSAKVVPVWVAPGTDVEMLVSLLEDVIYVTDVIGVPVRFHLVSADAGAVSGYMEVVDPSEVEQVGPVPKAVSYHGIEMGQRDGVWRCSAVIDV
jgi:SHS2 domain-containing protein